RVERSDYTELARSWGADQYWPQMQAGVQYCAVDMAPVGFLLTGPTMREFSVVDRRLPENCPAGSVQISAAPAPAAGSSLMSTALELIYQVQDYPAALEILDQMLQQNPRHFGAMWQRAEALERAGNTESAINA